MNFKEIEAKELTKYLFSFWNNHIDLFWVGYVNRAFNKKGAFYFENEKEERLIREKIVCAAILYFECSHRSAFHEPKNFNYWNKEIIVKLKEDFSDEIDDHMFAANNYLLDFFGSKEIYMFEFWINAYQGKENLILTLKEKSNLLNKLSGMYKKGDPNMLRLSQFIGYPGGIDEFEGLSI